MLKRIVAVLTAALIISTASIGAFADTTADMGRTYLSKSSTGSAINEGSSSTESAINIRKAKALLNEVIKEGNARDDSPLIMTITSPDKDKDSTYVKSYVLSGNSKYSDVIITIARYNENTREYELMYNTDNESSWEIGDFRLFSKEILLNEGTNKIKIISYRASQKDNLKTDDIQVNCFTIELLNKSIIGKIINKGKDILGDITDFLNK